MASLNPNQRFSRPRPLASPRTNPLETISRSAEEDSNSGLSVHRGVQGRITSNTPKVAHKVTNNSARNRNSHIRKPPLDWLGSETCTVTPPKRLSRDAVG